MPLEARFLTVFSLHGGYEQSLKMTQTFMSLALSNILVLSSGRYVTQSPVSDSMLMCLFTPSLMLPYQTLEPSY